MSKLAGVKRKASKNTIAGSDLAITADDRYLFNEGTHHRLYDKLGGHLLAGDAGAHFAVWAPNASGVTVFGDFNQWAKDKHFLQPQGNSGIWAGVVPEAQEGQHYKYHIWREGFSVDKADPFAFRTEMPPATASVLCNLDYQWGDEAWMQQRGDKQRLDAPISIYEVHWGSWRRIVEEGNRYFNYRELAQRLAQYIAGMGFTHVELLPIMEHPFYGSWGYQTTGYFAPSSRFGSPQDFMHLVDALHQAGVGVILDWVPSHFPNDEFALAFFDGTHLYEHADPRQGFHPDWNTCVFNYSRNEVRSFLLSSAMFWLDKYHADGLRVDAVASMLYLDYSRQEGEWVPNRFGGRENLEAIDFLRQLNTTVYSHFPGVQTFAEESTAWPSVSRPVDAGGLGFGFKWDMGWMHDTLKYMEKEPVHRQYHHNDITFRMVYAFNENFTLPLSHDEVVHGKGSLITKMPGDDWQKFASLRLLYVYMYAQPGKKLLFMGGEIAQWDEWNHDTSLQWHLLEFAPHQGVQRLVKDLNHLYRTERALHSADCTPQGFQWVIGDDAAQSILGFMRRGDEGDAPVLALLNFTPVPRHDYLVGVPCGGPWEELLNSDAGIYDGSGVGNFGQIEARDEASHGFEHSLRVTLPPLAGLLLRPKL